MAEFPHIGKLCSVDYCKQLDFLPFECDGCAKIYCLEHRGKDSHNCSRTDIPVNTVEYTGPKGYSCYLHSCSNRELTPVVCQHCNKSFCLSHRHQKDHQCERLDETVKLSKTAEHVQKILDAKGGKIAPPKHRGAKNPKTAAKVALMKLKMSAIGDKGIPDCDRVHLSVKLPGSTPEKPIFFSKRWTVGRVVDFIAASGGITNVNNTGVDLKLRLFVADSGNVLPGDQSLESLLDGDAQLYNGSSVILENVPDNCLCLYAVESK